LGRARIEQQKQIELAKIEAQRLENLKKLNIEYETKDKVAKSIGYIGIAFLTVLFGSIFGNDLIKLCIFYLNQLKEWCMMKKEMKKQEKEQTSLEINYVDNKHLEARLEKVYIKLLKANAINRSQN
jgi:hypothetical protein